MKNYFLGIVAICLGISCSKETKSNPEGDLESKETSVHQVFSYQKLEQFASGSGMTFYNDYFYIVGDDDPYLAKLNKKGEILQRFQLWDTSDVKDGRIHKKLKPDFEAISLFPYERDTLLLIFGSGSKSPKRDVIFTFNPKNEKIDTLNGRAFFAWLKTNAGLKNKEVNLEGATYHNGFLYLLNRHNNDLYQFPEAAFHNFISDQNTDGLKMKKHHFELPVYKKDTARFSGASIISRKNQLLFSATIETTDNWQDDGKILGSFVGKIDLDKLDNPNVFCAPVFNEDKTRFKGKIEALQEIVEDEAIYFITDDDDGSTGWGLIKE